MGDIAIRQDGAAEALIAQAIDKGVSVETMEKLLAMRKELVAEAARKAYFQDLARFQAACPIIGKDEIVKDKSGRERYRFAPIQRIVGDVGKLLEANGFSFHFETEQTDVSVAAICVSHHKAGHEERTRFQVPIDPEAYMNDAQKVASALTYAKRYALCNAFGIVTGDQDDDALSTGEPVAPDPVKQQKPPEKEQPKPAVTFESIDAQKVGKATTLPEAQSMANVLYNAARHSGLFEEEIKSMLEQALSRKADLKALNDLAVVWYAEFKKRRDARAELDAAAEKAFEKGET